MITVRCIHRKRNKAGIVTHYTLQDTQGYTCVVTPTVLKRCIKTKTLECINLTLTSDNRLIEKPEITPDSVLSAQDIFYANDFCTYFGINYKDFSKRLYAVAKLDSGWLDGCCFSLTIIRKGYQPCLSDSPKYWDTYDSFEYGFYKESPDCDLADNAPKGAAIFSRYIFWGSEQVNNTPRASIGFAFSRKDFNTALQAYLDSSLDTLKSEYSPRVAVNLFSGAEVSCTLDDILVHKQDYLGYFRALAIKQ